MKPLSVALLALVLALPAAAQKPVLISTDLATGLSGGWRAGNSDVDDGYAVAMAISDKQTYAVRGVITTFGNNNVEPETRVGQALLKLLGSNVPLKQGAAVVLTNPQVATPDGPMNDVCWNEGVELMATTLQKEQATILGLGPLTDVACLVLNAQAKGYSAAVGNIRELVVIMGREPNESFAIKDPWTGQLHTGLTDFNYVMDTRAAQTMLASTVPFMASFSAFSGEPGFHPWDQNAVFYVKDPRAYQCETGTYRVVNCGTAPYYKDANNPCAGHGPDQPSSLDKESSQLWLSTSIDRSPRIKVCTAYSSGAKERFIDEIFRFLSR